MAQLNKHIYLIISKTILRKTYVKSVLDMQSVIYFYLQQFYQKFIVRKT